MVIFIIYVLRAGLACMAWELGSFLMSQLACLLVTFNPAFRVWFKKVIIEILDNEVPVVMWLLMVD